MEFQNQKAYFVNEFITHLILKRKIAFQLENADDFSQGILKIGQGKVREFYFTKFVGTLK